MTRKEYPWDLSQVPHYDSAPAVPSENGEDLDARRFWGEYVLRNRPCLIKHAIRGWPAYRNWPDQNYLRSRLESVEVQASCAPRVESFGLRTKSQDATASKMTRDRLLAAESIGRVMDRLRIPDDEVLSVELRSSDRRVRQLGEDMRLPGGRFSFLSAPPKPRFMYSGWSVMFYKNSYSDWHFHPGNDAMMCQVMGTKDVLLLPPTQESWRQIVPIHVQEWKVYGVDTTKHPAYLGVRPYRVVVEPGDGLFIPVNWWHAVQARPGEFGATVPISWDSPFRDLRQPATRHFLRVLWRYQKAAAAAVFAASACSTAMTCFRQQLSGGLNPTAGANVST